MGGLLRCLAACTGLAVAMTGLAGGPVAATHPPTTTGAGQAVAAPLTARASVGGVPRHADARVGSLRGDVRVKALTRVPIYRRSDKSKARQADRISVQVVVRGPGLTRPGPVHVLDLDGPDRIARGSHIAVNKRTGKVTASLALTKAQSRAVAQIRRSGKSRRYTAGRVVVLIKQYKDTDPGTGEFAHVGSVGARARYRGAALGIPAHRPGTVTASGSTATIQLTNTTTNPLVLLAGPTTCMYDSVYDDQYDSNDASSHLGTLNGTILLPGQTVAVSVTSDHNIERGQQDEGFGAPVIADNATYLSYALHDAMNDSPQTLPSWEAPEGEQESDLPELYNELGEFLLDSARNLVDANGLWESLLEAFAEESWIDIEAVEALSAAWEVAGQALDALGPIFAIADGLVSLFENACSSHDGYIMIGATDQYHPWRQFAQVYDWGDASPSLPKQGNTTYGSVANGLLGNPVARASSPGGPDEFNHAILPTSVPGGWGWRFTAASTQANTPATVTLDPGSRTVRCSLPDGPGLTQQVATTAVPAEQPAWPHGPYLDWNGNPVAINPALTPNDYMVGAHYIPASHPTMSVRYTSNKEKWVSLPIPAGQDWVELPVNTASPARWVACDAQAPEMFTNETQSGRRVIMGTRVPSSVIAGPDWQPGS